MAKRLTTGRFVGTDRDYHAGNPKKTDLGIPQERYCWPSGIAEDLFDEMSTCLSVGEKCDVMNYNVLKFSVYRPELDVIVVSVPGSPTSIGTAGFYRKARCYPLKTGDLTPIWKYLIGEIRKRNPLVEIKRLGSCPTADQIFDQIKFLFSLI